MTDARDEGHEREREEGVQTHLAERRRRKRSIAIALALLGLVVLFYMITIVRLGGNVFNRAF